MPVRILARRSQLSLRTLYRVLMEHDISVGLKTVVAIADALWLSLDFQHRFSAESVIRLQAIRKAVSLAEMAQGTAALEGQAVSAEQKRKLQRYLVLRLINGPGSDLWD